MSKVGSRLSGMTAVMERLSLELTQTAESSRIREELELVILG